MRRPLLPPRPRGLKRQRRSPRPQPADTRGWQALTFPARSVRALALSPAYATDRTIVAAGGDGIYRSTDGGARWAALDVGLDGHATTWAQVAFSPDFARDRTLFLNNEARIYRSTDGGAHWSATLEPFQLFTLAFSPAYARDRTIFAAGAPAGIYRSLDGG